MTTQQETLADMVRISARPVVMILANLAERDRVRQAPGLPNHVAWTLGHCALTMHRVAERLEGGPLPDGDFTTGDGAAGDAVRFDTESVCFGSTPVDDGDRYPTLERARAIFDAAIDRLATAAECATDHVLEGVTVWGAAGDELRLTALVPRVAIHNGVHGGQLLDLRRALGLTPLLG